MHGEVVGFPLRTSDNVAQYFICILTEPWRKFRCLSTKLGERKGRARHQMLSDAWLLEPFEEWVARRAPWVFVHELRDILERSPQYSMALENFPKLIQRAGSDPERERREWRHGHGIDHLRHRSRARWRTRCH
jgi:hypothetical protein